MKRGACARTHRQIFLSCFSHPVNGVATHYFSAVDRRFAAWLLVAVFLCAGCASPFGLRKSCDTCGRPVDTCGECCECESAECPPCNECGPASCKDCSAPPCAVGFSTCATCYATAKCYTCCCCCEAWHTAEPVVCWPVKKCCHIMHFCAPDGYIGPTTPPGPGRFHPVPTQDVFQPASQPILEPVESAKDALPR
jgi:hypothetical protein